MSLSRTAPEGSASRRCVYVIDDDADIRKSLHFALATSNITAWPFGSPQDFLDQLETLAPAPILLDLRMPSMTGLQVLEVLRERRIDWPVIMISAHGDIPSAVRAIKLGATEFLEKPYILEELEGLLAKTFETLAIVLVSSERRDAAVEKLGRLTPRESEVMQLSARGMASKLVAHELGIGQRTVEVHRLKALAKLGVKSSSEVLRLQFEAGLSPSQ